MKMSVTFEGDTNEDREEIDRVLHAHDYYGILWDLSQWLRQQMKQGNDIHEAVQDKLFELLNARGIEL